MTDQAIEVLLGRLHDLLHQLGNSGPGDRFTYFRTEVESLGTLDLPESLRAWLAARFLDIDAETPVLVIRDRVIIAIEDILNENWRDD